MAVTFTREIILPSGKFAHLRPILWGDVVEAMRTGDGQMTATVLMSRCVTIDGEAFTVEQILALDVEEIIPVFAIIGEVLEKIMAAAKPRK